MTQEFLLNFYRNCVCTFMLTCAGFSVFLALKADDLAEMADKFGKLSSHFTIWTAINYRDPRCPEDIRNRYLAIRWKFWVCLATFLSAPYLFGEAGVLLGILK